MDEAIRRHNDAVRGAGRWRAVRTLDDGELRTTLIGGPELAGGDAAAALPVVHFASNDYLGLSQHPAVIAAATASLAAEGAGSGASRLVVGGRQIHNELEAELAAWTDHDAALLFPTGFAANMGVLGALVGAGGRNDTTVFSDELNHASIIDGIRAARARVEVYPHVDVDALADALSTRTTRHAIVVTDLVFSMDGDSAPLPEIAAVCAAHDAMLVLDEAHAALGPHDAAAVARAHGCEVVTVGTLSKTLGSLGGFVAGPTAVVELCTNTSRSFIFTTATPPSTAAAALAALRIVRSAEGDELRARLRRHVERISPGHPSPIVPVVLGSEAAALDASRALLDQGLLVPAIRPPTVAPGTSRLRVALSAAHSDDDIDRLAQALATIQSAGSAAPSDQVAPGHRTDSAVPAPSDGRETGTHERDAAALRPRTLVVVAGTGTEVGKTWVAAAVSRVLRDRGFRVAARKPAQSFEPSDLVPDADGQVVGTDADHLADATGEDPLVVCPPHRRYQVPMAPPMAADVLGRDRIAIDELAREVRASWGENGLVERADVGLVELAGGTRSPAAHDGDGVEFTRAIGPDLIVLVADAGLGTIHSVRSALDGLKALRAPIVVHLNRYGNAGAVNATELQRRNRDQLVADGCTVTTDIAALADAITSAEATSSPTP